MNQNASPNVFMMLIFWIFLLSFIISYMKITVVIFCFLDLKMKRDLTRVNL
ncbi:hypothetical protein LMG28727_06224 [Paraburkholderia kirstenboschensis]|nr:hypothetical protein LMG28727_06224 [Paraburkholderia kirstenboschensis]